MLERYVAAGIDLGQSALANSLQMDISAGTRFLFLASPIFESAKRFFATSVDTVSRFWIGSRTRRSAYEYLERHRPSPTHRTASKDGAHRLFVFHDAEVAHLHARVLDAHVERYREVFFCSRRAYERLLKDVIVDGNISAMRRRDFAVLDCGTEDKESLYFAELDEDQYRWEAIKPQTTMVGGNFTGSSSAVSKSGEI
jgi:hypothetical protein